MFSYGFVDRKYRLSWHQIHAKRTCLQGNESRPSVWATACLSPCAPSARSTRVNALHSIPRASPGAAMPSATNKESCATSPLTASSSYTSTTTRNQSGGRGKRCSSSLEGMRRRLDEGEGRRGWPRCHCCVWAPLWPQLHRPTSDGRRDQAWIMETPEAPCRS